MRIYVDKQEEKMGFAPGLSLGQVIDRLCAERISQERVITHVLVNGQEVLEDENGLFPDMATAEIDSLELKTELSQDMAFRGISDAKHYLERLTSGLSKTAELFRVGEEANAHEHYRLCVEGLNWLIQVLQGVKQVMGLNFEEILMKGTPVQSHIESLEETIRNMLSAQSDEDWVMLADLLEYELLSRMETWKKILPLMEEEAQKTRSEVDRRGEAKKRRWKRTRRRS